MNKTVHCVPLRMCDLGSKGDSRAGQLMAVPAPPALTSHGMCYKASCNTVKQRRQDRQPGLSANQKGLSEERRQILIPHPMKPTL